MAEKTIQYLLSKDFDRVDIQFVSEAADGTVTLASAQSIVGAKILRKAEVTPKTATKNLKGVGSKYANAVAVEYDTTLSLDVELTKSGNTIMIGAVSYDRAVFYFYSGKLVITVKATITTVPIQLGDENTWRVEASQFVTFDSSTGLAVPPVTVTEVA